MANALGIKNGDSKDELAVLQQELLEGVFKKAVSAQIKSKVYSGDPTSGSIVVPRFVNATSAAYGTARAGGKGAALNDKGKVVINVDTDREIIEEIEAKDINLFGIPDIVARRVGNHISSMTAALDTDFFKIAETAAHTVTTSETNIEDIVEALIQDVETTQNEYVNGVDRDQIVVTLSPSVYGKLRNHIDKVSNPTADSGEAEIEVFHGARVFSNIRQTSAVIAMVDGAIAQPVLVSEYSDEKINLSDAHAVELFYHYGTKAVTPDLIAKLDKLPAKAATDDKVSR